MKKRSCEKQETVSTNPLFHDTQKLLRKYRDVVWSLELSVQQAKRNFQREYGSSIDEFLESIYLAGADLSGSDAEHHAKCIERSRKMLQLIESAVELMRNRHKDGESYYWILYYTYLSPQQSRNVDGIVAKLSPHISDISLRTYFRKKQDAIEALSSVLWGYTSKECLEILEKYFPDR